MTYHRYAKTGWRALRQRLLAPLALAPLLVACAGDGSGGGFPEPARSEVPPESLTALPGQPEGSEDPLVVSPHGFQIAFVCRRDICIANEDGSGLTRLTETGRWSMEPAWSPDGRQIAFAQADGDRKEIHVMNADGSGERQLTNGPNDSRPGWSPDGSRIAFIRSKPLTSGGEAYAVDVDGSNELRLSAHTLQSSPAWSPDGRRIAFDAVGVDGGLYVASSDGSGEVLLDGRSDSDPIWSSDGSRILFGCEIDHHANICITNVDGSVLAQLAELGDPTAWVRPVWWSPDGSTIAFSTYQDGIVHYLVGVDGSDLRPIPPVDFSRAVLLYGTRIERISFLPGGEGDLNLVTEDGHQFEPLSAVESDGPVWSPDGRLMACHSINDTGSGFLFIRSWDGVGQTLVLPDGIDPVWSPVPAE